MASPSKEDKVLKLILENSPLKHWHFEELVKQTKMTRASLNKWLKKYQKEGIFKKVKEKGRFSYYTSGSNNQAYQAKKRIYMLNKLYQCGLVNHLMSRDGTKTIVIFGSIAKGDWYKGSDIDIFILGKPKNIDKHKYELKLKRDIELHIFESKKEVKKIKSGLINNVINGYIVKGKVQDIIK